MLGCVLGAEAFNAAIAKKEAAWQRRFQQAEDAERNLPPCLICGEPREFVSVSSRDDRICDACEHEVWQAAFGSCVSCGGEREVVGSAYTGGRCQDCATRELGPCRQCSGARPLSSGGRDGGLCPKCLDQQFGPCADCGRQLTSWTAEFGRDLCCDCTMRRREQEPCPRCGGHRHPYGSAHTGDLCWQCAEEQQPPCASCGTRLRLAREEGDICWPCRVNRHFHLPERPSGMNTR
jgi:hypothetical protein